MKEVSLIDKAVERFMDQRRPPEDIRDELDLGYTYQNQVLEIFEIRPYFLDKSRIIHSPVAKGRFIKSKGIWKIYRGGGPLDARQRKMGTLRSSARSKNGGWISSYRRRRCIRLLLWLTSSQRAIAYFVSQSEKHFTIDSTYCRRCSCSQLITIAISVRLNLTEN